MKYGRWLVLYFRIACLSQILYGVGQDMIKSTIKPIDHVTVLLHNPVKFLELLGNVCVNLRRIRRSELSFLSVVLRSNTVRSFKIML